MPSLPLHNQFLHSPIRVLLMYLVPPLTLAIWSISLSIFSLRLSSGGVNLPLPHRLYLLSLLHSFQAGNLPLIPAPHLCLVLLPIPVTSITFLSMSNLRFSSRRFILSFSIICTSGQHLWAYATRLKSFDNYVYIYIKNLLVSENLTWAELSVWGEERKRFR